MEGEEPPDADSLQRLHIQAWALLKNGMGGLDWAGLPYAVEHLGQAVLRAPLGLDWTQVAVVQGTSAALFRAAALLVIALYCALFAYSAWRAITSVSVVITRFCRLPSSAMM